MSYMSLSLPRLGQNHTTDGPPEARMHMFKHEGLQWLTNVIPMRKLVAILFCPMHVYKGKLAQVASVKGGSYKVLPVFVSIVQLL